MLEEFLPAFLDHLRELRYCTQTVARARIVSRRFLAYVGGRIRRPEELGPEHAAAWLRLLERRFHARHGRPMGAGRRASLTMSLGRLLRYLASRGLCPRAVRRRRRDPCAVPGHERLLAEYELFLRVHRGLARGTREAYLDQAARLCRACGPEASAGWDALSPEGLADHLLAQARGRSPSTVLRTYSALRSFFRFLRTTGRSTKRLERLLVRYRVVPRARIPATLSTEELYRVAKAVEGETPRRLLDRAVILLLLLYGLRIGELARLRLEDIQWRAQQLVFRERKAGRDLVLPLHPVAAGALAAYIERARPRETPYREVFLSQVEPHPYLRGSNLARGVTRQLRREGIRLRLHALRHTVATRLINHDCPPAWIQILLGHASFESTRRYAQVDLAHLREVTGSEVLDR